MSNVINMHATNLRDEIQSVNLIGEVIVNLHVLDRDPALESFSQALNVPAWELVRRAEEAAEKKAS